jgi:hypothetical protein
MKIIWTRRDTYERLLSREWDAYERAARKRAASRGAWTHVEKQIKAHFATAQSLVNKGGWFEFAYASSTPAMHQVQFFLGQHPINGKLDTEAGAAAVVSQSETGEVIFLLYPYESTARRMKKPHIVWHITSEPMSVKDSLIARFIADFLVYSRVSSALFSETTSDRERVRHLEERSRALEGFAQPFPGRLGKWVLALGSGLLFFLFCAWIKDSFADKPQGWFEPTIGLLALLIAWLTAAVTSWDEGMRRAEVHEDALRAKSASEAARSGEGGSKGGPARSN